MGTKWIKTKVAEASPYYSWPAGKIIEVSEEEAAGRVADGRAVYVDAPAQRQTADVAGQPVETASLQGGEQRREPSAIIDEMLALLPGLPSKVVDALMQAGYDSRDDLEAASDDDLMAVDGIAEATVKKIRAALTGENA